MVLRWPRKRSNTDFGDNTSSSGSSSGGSELDAVYSAATNGYLYLFIAGIAVGFNNKNTAGVNGTSGTAANPTAANAVTNGLELGIPLSALGNPTGSVQVLVCINGSSFVYLSNQFIQGFKNFAAARVSKGSPWKLQKAWWTDQNDHTIEEYPIQGTFKSSSQPDFYREGQCH